MSDLIDKISNMKWKPIIHSNQKTNYEVSESGMIRNIGTMKILRPAKTKDGFYQVTLIINGRHVTKKVHQLVAEAFLPNEKSRKKVRHLNGNKLDNRVENLEWAGPLKGIWKPFPVDNSGLCGENAPNNKYSAEKIAGVCGLLNEGGRSIREISEITGVSVQTISSVKSRRSWRHISENYL